VSFKGSASRRWPRLSVRKRTYGVETAKDTRRNDWFRRKPIAYLPPPSAADFLLGDG
jgi:hypothetical protein